MSIRYVSRDLPGVRTGASGAASQLSTAEEVLEIAVDLICDVALPTEVSKLDPTGLETASVILDACMSTLFKVGEHPASLGGLLIDIRYDGDAPGDDGDISTPDAARLAERITLVYRSRVEYPHGILEN